MANIYSVSQINTSIKRLIAQDPMLGLVYVRGEISNLTYHRTGHIYFTLKDEKASISGIMFASSKSNLTFKLDEGMEVIVQGRIDYYEGTGKCSLIASRIKQEGVGSLAEKFEALKEKLADMGLFANEYKQAIPKFSKIIGVVTAPTGAAVQDIINISKRRNPGIQIVLYPALVQGENAAKSIIKGIEILDEYGVDVIIVGRGGGSMEDLFCFNDEELAMAIFNCQTPIISAVGHETDFTIADFVADLRAPTPSAAAELAVFDMFSIISRINDYERRLNISVDRVINNKKTLLDNKIIKLKNCSPEKRLSDNKKRVADIEGRLNQLMDMKLLSMQNINEIKDKLNHLMDVKISDKKHSFNIYLEKLKGLSPLEKLSQGYSYMVDCNGKNIRTVNNVNKGDELCIYVKDGQLTASVIDKEYIDRIGDDNGNK